MQNYADLYIFYCRICNTHPNSALVKELHNYWKHNSKQYECKIFKTGVSSEIIEVNISSTYLGEKNYLPFFLFCKNVLISLKKLTLSHSYLTDADLKIFFSVFGLEFNDPEQIYVMSNKESLKERKKESRDLEKQIVSMKKMLHPALESLDLSYNKLSPNSILYLIEFAKLDHNIIDVVTDFERDDIHFELISSLKEQLRLNMTNRTKVEINPVRQNECSILGFLKLDPENKLCKSRNKKKRGGYFEFPSWRDNPQYPLYIKTKTDDTNETLDIELKLNIVENFGIADGSSKFVIQENSNDFDCKLNEKSESRSYGLVVLSGGVGLKIIDLLSDDENFDLSTLGRGKVIAESYFHYSHTSVTLRDVKLGQFIDNCSKSESNDCEHIFSPFSVMVTSFRPSNPCKFVLSARIVGINKEGKQLHDSIKYIISRNYSLFFHDNFSSFDWFRTEINGGWEKNDKIDNVGGSLAQPGWRRNTAFRIRPSRQSRDICKSSSNKKNGYVAQSISYVSQNSAISNTLQNFKKTLGFNSEGIFDTDAEKILLNTDEEENRIFKKVEHDFIRNRIINPSKLIEEKKNAEHRNYNGTADSYFDYEKIVMNTKLSEKGLKLLSKSDCADKAKSDFVLVESNQVSLSGSVIIFIVLSELFNENNSVVSKNEGRTFDGDIQLSLLSNDIYKRIPMRILNVGRVDVDKSKLILKREDVLERSSLIAQTKSREESISENLNENALAGNLKTVTCYAEVPLRDLDFYIVPAFTVYRKIDSPYSKPYQIQIFSTAPLSVEPYCHSSISFEEELTNKVEKVEEKDSAISRVFICDRNGETEYKLECRNLFTQWFHDCFVDIVIDEKFLGGYIGDNNFNKINQNLKKSSSTVEENNSVKNQNDKDSRSLVQLESKNKKTRSTLSVGTRTWTHSASVEFFVNPSAKKAETFLIDICVVVEPHFTDAFNKSSDGLCVMLCTLGSSGELASKEDEKCMKRCNETVDVSLSWLGTISSSEVTTQILDNDACNPNYHKLIGVKVGARGLPKYGCEEIADGSFFKHKIIVLAVSDFAQFNPCNENFEKNEGAAYFTNIPPGRYFAVVMVKDPENFLGKTMAENAFDLHFYTSRNVAPAEKTIYSSTESERDSNNSCAKTLNYFKNPYITFKPFDSNSDNIFKRTFVVPFYDRLRAQLVEDYLAETACAHSVHAEDENNGVVSCKVNLGFRSLDNQMYFFNNFYNLDNWKGAAQMTQSNKTIFVSKNENDLSSEASIAGSLTFVDKDFPPATSSLLFDIEDFVRCRGLPVSTTKSVETATDSANTLGRILMRVHCDPEGLVHTLELAVSDNSTLYHAIKLLNYNSLISFQDIIYTNSIAPARVLSDPNSLYVNNNYNNSISVDNSRISASDSDRVIYENFNKIVNFSTAVRTKENKQLLQCISVYGWVRLATVVKTQLIYIFNSARAAWEYEKKLEESPGHAPDTLTKFLLPDGSISGPLSKLERILLLTLLLLKTYPLMPTVNRRLLHTLSLNETRNTPLETLLPESVNKNNILFLIRHIVGEAKKNDLDKSAVYATPLLPALRCYLPLFHREAPIYLGATCNNLSYYEAMLPSVLSALAVITSSRRFFERTVIRYDNDIVTRDVAGNNKTDDVKTGRAFFRFFLNAEWREIAVDDYLPVTPVVMEYNCAEDYKSTPLRPYDSPLCFLGGIAVGDALVPMIEKAYAKVHGSYGACFERRGLWRTKSAVVSLGDVHQFVCQYPQSSSGEKAVENELEGGDNNNNNLDSSDILKNKEDNAYERSNILKKLRNASCLANAAVAGTNMQNSWMINDHVITAISETDTFFSEMNKKSEKKEYARDYENTESPLEPVLLTIADTLTDFTGGVVRIFDITSSTSSSLGCIDTDMPLASSRSLLCRYNGPLLVDEHSAEDECSEITLQRRTCPNVSNNSVSTESYLAQNVLPPHIDCTALGGGSLLVNEELLLTKTMMNSDRVATDVLQLEGSKSNAFDVTRTNSHKATPKQLFMVVSREDAVWHKILSFVGPVANSGTQTQDVVLAAVHVRGVSGWRQVQHQAQLAKNSDQNKNYEIETGMSSLLMNALYPIIDAREVEGKRLVKIYNNYGNMGCLSTNGGRIGTDDRYAEQGFQVEATTKWWKGAYAWGTQALNGTEGWTPDLQRAVGYDESDSAMEFWMSLTELLFYFSHLVQVSYCNYQVTTDGVYQLPSNTSGSKETLCADRSKLLSFVHPAISHAVMTTRGEVETLRLTGKTAKNVPKPPGDKGIVIGGPPMPGTTSWIDNDQYELIALHSDESSASPKCSLKTQVTGYCTVTVGIHQQDNTLNINRSLELGGFTYSANPIGLAVIRCANVGAQSTGNWGLHNFASRKLVYLPTNMVSAAALKGGQGTSGDHLGNQESQDQYLSHSKDKNIFHNEESPLLPARLVIELITINPSPVRNRYIDIVVPISSVEGAQNTTLCAESIILMPFIGNGSSVVQGVFSSIPDVTPSNRVVVIKRTIDEYHTGSSKSDFEDHYYQSRLSSKEFKGITEKHGSTVDSTKVRYFLSARCQTNPVQLRRLPDDCIACTISGSWLPAGIERPNGLISYVNRLNFPVHYTERLESGDGLSVAVDTSLSSSPALPAICTEEYKMEVCTAGGAPIFGSWMNNPQYLIYPSRDCEVTIILRQHKVKKCDNSLSSGCKTDADKLVDTNETSSDRFTSRKNKDFAHIGFVVVDAGGSLTRLTYVGDDPEYAIPGFVADGDPHSCVPHYSRTRVLLNVPHSQVSAVSGTVFLSGMTRVSCSTDQGECVEGERISGVCTSTTPYHLIPSQLLPFHGGSFTLTICSTSPITVTRLGVSARALSSQPCSSVPRSIKNRDLHRFLIVTSFSAFAGNCGGSPHYTTWRCNPQFVLNFPGERTGRLFISATALPSKAYCEANVPEGGEQGTSTCAIFKCSNQDSSPLAAEDAVQLSGMYINGKCCGEFGKLGRGVDLTEYARYLDDILPSTSQNVTQVLETALGRRALSQEPLGLVLLRPDKFGRGRYRKLTLGERLSSPVFIKMVEKELKEMKEVGVVSKATPASEVLRSSRSANAGEFVVTHKGLEQQPNVDADIPEREESRYLHCKAFASCYEYKYVSESNPSEVPVLERYINCLRRDKVNNSAHPVSLYDNTDVIAASVPKPQHSELWYSFNTPLRCYEPPSTVNDVISSFGISLPRKCDSGCTDPVTRARLRDAYFNQDIASNSRCTTTKGCSSELREFPEPIILMPFTERPLQSNITVFITVLSTSLLEISPVREYVSTTSTPFKVDSTPQTGPGSRNKCDVTSGNLFESNSSAEKSTASPHNFSKVGAGAVVGTHSGCVGLAESGRAPLLPCAMERPPTPRNFYRNLGCGRVLIIDGEFVPGMNAGGCRAFYDSWVNNPFYHLRLLGTSGSSRAVHLTIIMLCYPRSAPESGGSTLVLERGGEKSVAQFSVEGNRGTVVAKGIMPPQTMPVHPLSPSFEGNCMQADLQSTGRLIPKPPPGALAIPSETDTCPQSARTVERREEYLSCFLPPARLTRGRVCNTLEALCTKRASVCSTCAQLASAARNALQLSGDRTVIPPFGFDVVVDNNEYTPVFSSRYATGQNEVSVIINKLIPDEYGVYCGDAVSILKKTEEASRAPYFLVPHTFEPNRGVYFKIAIYSTEPIEIQKWEKSRRFW